MGWLGRRAALFGLIVAALIAHQLVRPSFETYGELSSTVARLREDAAALRAFAADATGRSDAAVVQAQNRTAAELDARIRDARRERERLRADCSGDLAAMLRGGPDRVIENRKRCVRGALLDREIAALTAFRDTAAIRRPGESLPQAVGRQTAIIHQRAEVIRAGGAALRALDERFLADLRFAAERRALRARMDAAERDAERARGNAARLIAAQSRLRVSAAAASRTLAEVQAEFDRLLATKAEQLGDTAQERARGWAERVDLSAKMWTAALALLAIVVTPYLIRVIFYFVLAPIAERRPAIRLRVPEGSATPIPPAERSTTSVGVRLADGEELLVRQDYLQASAAGGAKRTRWLLDWRHPLSSIAAGLTFLTRIRGAGELVTISAVRDPFAEVTLLTLPPGASCVLQPRALAAAAQPIGRPLRVTSHWRLGSLNAWLTLQLRYLVFHGPARLVVKGGRGVRVEPATRGRVFGQDQLVGFSADLRYSVARAETFWPYFFGLEPLLKDKVIGGGGVLLVEEAPLAGRRAGVTRGLEGAMDAILKVVGI